MWNIRDQLNLKIRTTLLDRDKIFDKFLNML